MSRIGAYEPVKKVYVDNSGQSSGLGLMGCRIAAGVTTGEITFRFQFSGFRCVQIIMISHGF